MKSMTGYGRATFSNESFDIDIEIKSVNQKFLDLKISIPRELNFYELTARDLISKKIKRGKVDTRLTIIDKRIPQIEIDELKLNAYKTVYEKISEITQTNREIFLQRILDEPGVIISKGNSSEDPELVNILNSVLNEAVNKHQIMAHSEGLSMKEYICSSFEKMSSSIAHIKSEFPVFKEFLFNRLKDSVLDLVKNELKEDSITRLMTEAAVYADKADVTEEVVRIENHIAKVNHIIQTEQKEIGKTINFILQEMQREINTIGSKFSDPSVFNDIIFVKEEVEKCKEIIQNVE